MKLKTSIVRLKGGVLSRFPDGDKNMLLFSHHGIGKFGSLLLIFAISCT